MIAALQLNRPGTSQEQEQRPEPAAQRPRQRNVGDLERLLSVVGGSALAVFGLTRGSLGGLALGLVGGSLLYRGVSGHCSLYSALGVNTAGEPSGQSASVAAGAGVKVEKVVTIDRPREELFRFWRDFSNLPHVMRHLDSVTNTGAGRTRWVANAPLGLRLQWETEIINEKQNELIAWRSLPGGSVDTAGSVHFTPAAGNRGTEVRVTLKYDPPAGQLGATIARWLGHAPEQEVQEDLRRFKQWMEAGEVPTVQGQSSGRF